MNRVWVHWVLVWEKTCLLSAVCIYISVDMCVCVCVCVCGHVCVCALIDYFQAMSRATELPHGSRGSQETQDRIIRSVQEVVSSCQIVYRGASGGRQQ